MRINFDHAGANVVVVDLSDDAAMANVRSSQFGERGDAQAEGDIVRRQYSPAPLADMRKGLAWKEYQRYSWFEQQMRDRGIGRGDVLGGDTPLDGGVFMVVGLDRLAVLP